MQIHGVHGDTICHNDRDESIIETYVFNQRLSHT